MKEIASLSKLEFTKSFNATMSQMPRLISLSNTINSPWRETGLVKNHFPLTRSEILNYAILLDFFIAFIAITGYNYIFG
jgi:hypothetical protein